MGRASGGVRKDYRGSCWSAPLCYGNHPPHLMTTWKHCEREVARLLGGERTGCNGESRRDVEHP